MCVRYFHGNEGNTGKRVVDRTNSKMLGENHWLDPYMRLSREEWAELRGDWRLTLSNEQIKSLRGLNEPLSAEEVSEVYLPMCRFLDLFMGAAAGLHGAASEFLGRSHSRVPFVIALAGSVSVGKSTTARVIKSLLETGGVRPNVEIVTTDGFLYPNEELKQRNLMHRKGSPESYDRRALVEFLWCIKSGESSVAVPTYSHITYDIVPDARRVIQAPDVLILEGLNVLQSPPASRDYSSLPHISQFIDFSIYLDAPHDLLELWYVNRFRLLRDTSFRQPDSFFSIYSDLSDAEADAEAIKIWRTINLPNLIDNIEPTRSNATAILTKADDHRVESIALRKL